MLKLYNTRTRQKEQFKPLSGKNVGLYTCGPTVYNYAHIGNLRTYVFEDILRRVLRINDYFVNHVMNITDVGHLTDDADQGEDKMEKGSKREGKTAWEIAEFYTQAFKNDIRDLNILEPGTWCKATDHIQEQIDMVESLIKKGLTYETDDGIYFDTTKIDDYGKLALLDKQELKAGARIEMGEKRNLRDFALWKFSKPGETRQMEWDAFDRKGFPGWHIECSAMSTKYLGEQFDIHCGGIDHIPIHHTNEIAQTESVTGTKPWVNFWLHGEFLNMGDIKMAKSEDNFVRLQTLKDNGISPLAYRYFLLQAHYRKQLNFTIEALQGAEQGLKNLREKVSRIDKTIQEDPKMVQEFFSAVNDDLNMPEALAILQTGLKTNSFSLESITKFDKILALDLKNNQEEEIEISEEIQELLNAREIARESRDYARSDELRNKISSLGFTVEDKKEGQELKKN